MKADPQKKLCEDKCDDFLPTLNSIFSKAWFFGVSTYGINIAFSWSIILFLMLFILEVGAIRKLIRLLAGMALNDPDGRGMTARLSGSIFYGNALLSLVLSWRFINSWRTISIHWLRTETTVGLRFPADRKIRKRVLFVTVFIAVCATVEHIMSMISSTGLDCPPEELFRRYILVSHGFLLHPHEFNLWVAVPIFILSKLATILWNFQDLIIILISMGLTSRYHRMNLYVNHVVRLEKKVKDIKKFSTEIYAELQIWRRLREAYVRQNVLVRMVDKELGALVLLSNINNLYFICLQLFLGLNKDKGAVINRMYYFFSLGWLIFRSCSVVIAASDVHMHSKRALPSLFACPATAYNVEVKRLQNHVSNNFVFLTGMGFFSLRRQLLLQVAATIVKYELVLIQYDKFSD